MYDQDYTDDEPLEDDTDVYFEIDLETVKIGYLESISMTNFLKEKGLLADYEKWRDLPF